MLSCPGTARAVNLGLFAGMAWRLFFAARGHKDAGAGAFGATCARHDLACFVDRHRQVGYRPDVLAIAAPAFQRPRRGRYVLRDGNHDREILFSAALGMWTGRPRASQAVPMRQTPPRCLSRRKRSGRARSHLRLPLRLPGGGPRALPCRPGILHHHRAALVAGDRLNLVVRSPRGGKLRRF